MLQFTFELVIWTMVCVYVGVWIGLFTGFSICKKRGAAFADGMLEGMTHPFMCWRKRK